MPVRRYGSNPVARAACSGSTICRASSMPTEAGMGIAALPDYVAVDRKGLVRILPDVEGPTFDVHLAYCDALRQSKRVGAFRDFLVREAKEWRY